MQKTTETLSLDDDAIASIINAIQNGVSIADICNLSSDALEGLYSLAYNYYNACDYKNAEILFQSLCVYKYNEYRFWMGLAGCRQALDNLTGAIDAYSLAGVASLLKNPVPFFYAAQCYLKLGDKENAIGGLKGLITMCDDTNAEHVDIKGKSEELLTLLTQNA